MRKEFVECKRSDTAGKRCPWACVIVKVTGGYQCFESWTEFLTWRDQK